MDFIALKVINIHRQTLSAVSISFRIPLFRKGEFRYRAGQYLTIRSAINGEKVHRNYSLSSAPHEKKWTITVKEMPDDPLSKYLNHELKTGDTLLVHQPEGRFTLDTDPELARKIVLVGAGSGITPLMSHLKTLLKEEPRTEVLLLYGNRTVKDIIFKQELDALEAAHDQLKVVHFISREKEPGNCTHWEFGRVTRDNLYEVVKKHLGYPGHPVVPVYLLCGPAEMIGDLREYLYEILVPRLNVLTEFFTSEDALSGEVMPADSVDCTAAVVLHGEEHEIGIPAGTTVLDAVINAGLDAPYSCTSGICTTCIARQTEGVFDTSGNISLSTDDFEEGFILTCSTICLSKTARIDYDDT